MLRKIVFTLFVVSALIRFTLPTLVKAVATGEDFTLVVIPDTQNAAEHNPSLMNNQFQWIADQYRAQSNATIAKNIVFVMGVGDIVNTSQQRAAVPER